MPVVCQELYYSWLLYSMPPPETPEWSIFADEETNYESKQPPRVVGE